MKALFDVLAITVICFIIVVSSSTPPKGIDAAWAFGMMYVCFRWLHRGNV